MSLYKTSPTPRPSRQAASSIPAIQFVGGPLALRITHKLHAGVPSPAADYTADPLDLNQYLVDRVACTFLFEVAGWSMSGAHIVEGDKVVVDRSISPQPGHIVVAIVNGDFTIKPLRLRHRRASRSSRRAPMESACRACARSRNR